MSVKNVSTYISNPIEIEAILRDGTVERDHEIIDWLQENGGDFVYEPIPDEVPQDRQTQARFQVHSLEGLMEFPVGHYLIRGTQGEFYPCAHEVFKVKYKGLRQR